MGFPNTAALRVKKYIFLDLRFRLGAGTIVAGPNDTMKEDTKWN
jgi:hypothetical protein